MIIFTGDPISCINDGAVPTHVINTYCWITYTFTLPGLHGKPIGTHVAQSGVGSDQGDKTYHSYYQWVPFTLFMQVCNYVLCVKERILIQFFLLRASYSMYLTGSGKIGNLVKFV